MPAPMWMKFVAMETYNLPTTTTAEASMNAATRSLSLRALWRAQHTMSKCVIALCLLLIAFAYWPTLRSDYVAPDQWRTFRYLLLPKSPWYRATTCATTVAPYYSRTGRPLLWLSECAEHAAVAEISDFAYLRPFVLAIVLFTAIYLGAVLAPFVGGLAMGVVATSAFAMSPAYAVMYLQGMTGATVLISLILATASFGRWRDWLLNTGSDGTRKPARLIAPLALFFVGCLIYPSWMFIVVGLSWFAVMADVQIGRTAMLKRLCLTLLFYALTCLLYYLFERLIETVLEESTRYVPDMGIYSMAMLLNPSSIGARVHELATWFCWMPPLNFPAPHGVLLVCLVLFCAYIGWQDRKYNGARPLTSLSVLLATFAVGGVVLLGSISPWLFSSMDYMASRFVAPWYLFFCVVTVAVVRFTLSLPRHRLEGLAAPVALTVFLLPVAIVQNRLSRLETQVSGLEIQTMRTALDHWLDDKGYENQRYLLVVRPVRLRPTFAERLLGDSKYTGENAQLASAQNPVVVPWMANAVLRERLDQPMGRTVGLNICIFDQPCVARTLSDPHNVAIGIEDPVHVIKSSITPYVINLSLITSKPVIPIIEHQDAASARATQLMP